MLRRDIITKSVLGGLATVAATLVANSAAQAGAGKSSEAEGAPTYELKNVGLPVVVDGRLRNYVFVSMKLSLGAGQTPETLREKDPYLRDALIRTGHRVPLGLSDDWTHMDEGRINAAMVAIGRVVAGEGAVVACEVTSQTSRRQTGMRNASTG